MVGSRKGWRPVDEDDEGDGEVVDAVVVEPRRRSRRGTTIAYRSDGRVEVDGRVDAG
jgi:hypothetical protein